MFQPFTIIYDPHDFKGILHMIPAKQTLDIKTAMKSATHNQYPVQFLLLHTVFQIEPPEAETFQITDLKPFKGNQSDDQYAKKQ